MVGVKDYKRCIWYRPFIVGFKDSQGPFMVGVKDYITFNISPFMVGVKDYKRYI